ncbi:transporter substrate-binding domain-containing protein [Bosea sp. BK604]|uniref:transporter substrate-binding domain-containing protein n=1 Tax=Bosea sp. BK604 TaxID=2512180 RepID=UPI00104836EA|nr:transporter substrate-binding domain-containing protein [Bosea sp. BK604]TCR66598.1 amino acid ABC transporter substrate-binding protein (PAAT family) [Bosea sp. BK604]
MTLKPSALALAVALASLAALPAPAKDWTKVRIGIEGAFPPWNATTADGKLVGLDVDLLADLCKRAKVECELIANEWSSIVPSLNAGKFDMVMSLGINEARKKIVDFTVPYATGAATFTVSKSGGLAALPLAQQRLDLTDKAKADPVMAEIRKILKGKTVGVVQSTSHEQLIRQYFGDDVSVRTYKTSQERDLDLIAGRIDIGFDSAVYAATLHDKPGNEDIALAGPLIKGPPLATDVAMGVRKGDDDLRAIFDKAIKEAAGDGTIRTISTKWSKLDLTPQ